MHHRTLPLSLKLLLLAVTVPALAFGGTKNTVKQITNCPALPAFASTINDSFDANAATSYRVGVATVLMQENFSALDCLADNARTTKAKYASGTWKIHLLYAGLAQPQQHPTEQDWTAHLERLGRWVAQNPDSITARIAFAHAYLDYAWDGNPTTVSPRAWKQFGERVDRAKDIADQATQLPAKDPELFVVQMQIAQDQGVDRPAMTDLFKTAVAFEPTYQYYYDIYATYLLPKWYGQAGDTQQFAAQAADKLGGKAGDILYFQIAAAQVCQCGDDEVTLKSFSWPRIQKGFAAQEKRAGFSLLNINQMAFLATVFDDPTFANAQFNRLGNRWSAEVWHTPAYFAQTKSSVADVVTVAAAKQTSTSAEGK
jgi:hypothetical protein